MKKLALNLMAIFFILSFAGMAGATYIKEAKWNNTFEEAQNLEGAFSKDPDSDIFLDTTSPHASVYGSIRSKKDIDYYSFFVSQPYMSGFFDIDYGDKIDTAMALFDSNHNLLAFNKISGPTYPDSGSQVEENGIMRDSFIGVYTFTTPDTYYLAVTNFTYFPKFPEETDPEDLAPLYRPDGELAGTSYPSGTIVMLPYKGPGLDLGGTYTLHVSLTSPVPEPATILLLGSGLIGLAAIRKSFKT